MKCLMEFSHRYAIGGFDGGTMVASVEVFDPRRGTWISEAPMNESRGYFAAAGLNGSIYAIGGIGEEGNTLEKVHFLRPLILVFNYLLLLLSVYHS